MTKQTGMEEVITHERAIREFLRMGGFDMAATGVMGGIFPATGTRLDALKEISKRLKLVVDL